MSVSQADKAKKLRALHEAPGAFVIPNPWDAGSARVLEAIGFQALATSSGAKAGVLGKRDGKVSREESIANARLIAGAVDIPVIGDLEKGFGDTPKDAVREYAERRQLPVARKPDSQEICFIPDHDYAAFLERQPGDGGERAGVRSLLSEAELLHLASLALAEARR